MPKNPNVAQIYSIFGQIEEVAARTMIEEGTAQQLPGSPSAIPPECRVNEQGEQARMFVTIKNRDVPRFEQLCGDLYA